MGHEGTVHRVHQGHARGEEGGEHHHLPRRHALRNLGRREPQDPYLRRRVETQAKQKAEWIHLPALREGSEEGSEKARQHPRSGKHLVQPAPASRLAPCLRRRKLRQTPRRTNRFAIAIPIRKNAETSVPADPPDLSSDTKPGFDPDRRRRLSPAKPVQQRSNDQEKTKAPLYPHADHPGSACGPRCRSPRCGRRRRHGEVRRPRPARLAPSRTGWRWKAAKAQAQAPRLNPTSGPNRATVRSDRRRCPHPPVRERSPASISISAGVVRPRASRRSGLPRRKWSFAQNTDRRP